MREEVSAPDPVALLSAWLTLEVLTPQPLPKDSDLRDQKRMAIPLPDSSEQGPWMDRRYWRKGKEKRIYWFLQLGEVDLGLATERLLEVFPDDSPEPVRRSHGKTTLAFAVLDGFGRLLLDSAVVSSFPWGYGLVRRDRLGDLVNFSADERDLQKELESRLLVRDANDEPLPVEVPSVYKALDWLISQLGLSDSDCQRKVIAIRVPVSRQTAEAPEPELLNSFFLPDLQRVRAAIGIGTVGTALASYLRSKPNRQRRDVARSPDEIRKLLAPGQIPPARWPTRGGYPLVLMQQAAIQHAIRELEGPGLLGINGPPGTGKTTLLRDLVAHVVTRRAEALAAFDDPLEAFQPAAKMKLGQGFMHLYRVHESLLGHEILVASSNNKAVENISREIPSAEAVSEDESLDLRYFKSIADFIHGSAGGGEGANWGMAAGVLGNRSNIYQFVQRFWWDEQRGFRKYLFGVAKGWEGGSEARTVSASGVEQELEEATPNVLILEDAPRSAEEAKNRWKDARRVFRVRLERVRELRQQLQLGLDAIEAEKGLEEEIGRVEETIVELTGLLTTLESDLEGASSRLESNRRRIEELTEDRRMHLMVAPGLLQRLFDRAGTREWKAVLSHLNRDLSELRARQRGFEQENDAFAEKRQEHGRQLADREAAINRLVYQRQQRVLEIERARELAGPTWADEKFWSQSDDLLQRSSPWLGPELQRARDLLFAASFSLHRAFIDAAAKRIRHNLAVALAVVGGHRLRDKQEPARRSLWATLFLVVPVLSTTFASVGRLLGTLGQEQIGWLLIDEAGQATPQSAVGAIWRAERVVAIGDPMQIEPVVPMPRRLIEAVFRQFGIDSDEWAAPDVSVQVLADRASWFGAWLRNETGDLWVGSPLRTHRRCQEPMFSVSNQVAYDGLMVQATPNREGEIGQLLGPSRWFNVLSAPADKWSEDEGRVALQLVARLFEEGVVDPDVFLITPFRAVAGNLRTMLQEGKGLPVEFVARAEDWCRDRIGTVHTFQGKEAEAVIFVLGAAGAGSEGARRWAGSAPNLLNVAVSRAKERLYVVGRHEAWRDVGCFRLLAQKLDAEEAEFPVQ